MTRWWRRQWGLVMVNDQADPPEREESPVRCWTAAGAERLRGEWWAAINAGSGMTPKWRLDVARLGPFDEVAYPAQNGGAP